MTLVRRGPRAEVRRDDGVIVKTYLVGGEGWVREAAGLATVGRLLAETVEPPSVTTPDLGRVPTVADRLMGSDPAAAADAVVAWARAMARLHRTTRGRRDDFRAELDRRAGAWPVADATSGTALADAARSVEQRAAALGLDLAFDVGPLLARLGDGHDAASLSPGDCCPDNGLLVGDRVELVDFEGAEWRHAAWDAAYLSVPWPTCWCSWRLPDDVSDRALDAFRDELSGHAATAAFDDDLAAARTAWAWISADWFLERALGDDPPLHPGAPPRRAMVLHRLITCGDPAAADLADVLAARWGDVPLPLAPAFR